MFSLVMGTLMYNFDLIALAILGHRAEAGPYLSSYRLVTIFGPLLAALQNTILPQFAACWPDTGALRRQTMSIAAVSGALLAVSAVFLFLFATPVLRLLYGPEIANAAGLARVLVWVLPVQGVRTVLRQALYAFRGQAKDARAIALGAFTNIALDITLVPHFGATACAWSTLAAECMILTVIWIEVPRPGQSAGTNP
jgi:O-antigen/teichoic acid export membrane protein